MPIDLIYDFDVCLFKSVVTNKVEKTHKTVKSTYECQRTAFVGVCTL